MLSHKTSNGQPKSTTTGQYANGQNFLNSRNANTDASRAYSLNKIYQEVGRDLSITDFLDGRQSPVQLYALPKQDRPPKLSPKIVPIKVEVDNLDFGSILRRLQQHQTDRAYQEINITVTLRSSTNERSSLTHWLDYLTLRELQERGLDVLYRFELGQDEPGMTREEDRSSLAIDAAKTLDPPVAWQPPSRLSQDLLSFLRRRVDGNKDGLGGVHSAKVMYDALQVAAAEVAIGTAIFKLRSTEPSFQSAVEITRLERALEWIRAEAESTSAIILRRRAHRRALSG